LFCFELQAAPANGVDRELLMFDVVCKFAKPEEATLYGN
jgi:hypothetical protein